MLKFFRKIRHKMLAENKFSKYVIYAIGEIILVVIGILIALQINNWQQITKDLEKEQKVLRQLKNEYEINLIQLEEKISMRNEIILAATKFLRYTDENQNMDRDSLIYQLAFFVRDPTFDPISNDLIVSGNLRLIGNDSLKQKLSNWLSNVYQLQEIEHQWQQIRTATIVPYFIKTGLERDIANMIWKDGYTPAFALDKTVKITYKLGSSKKIIETEILLNDSMLEGISASAINWSQIGNLQSFALKNKILEILRLLEKEIE